MIRIARTVCGLGWFGAVIVFGGMLDGGAPIGTCCAVGAASLIAAVWGGWRAGIMR